MADALAAAAGGDEAAGDVPDAVGGKRFGRNSARQARKEEMADLKSEMQHETDAAEGEGEGEGEEEV